MRVLITGANGFVGRRLVEVMAAQPTVQVRAAVRQASLVGRLDVETVVCADLDSEAFSRSAVADVDVVIHLAARVHVMRDAAMDPLAEFRRVNVAATRRLAKAAAASGTRRFVFVSSVKVNGESTSLQRPFRCNDEPRPVDAYGISKWEAELALGEVAAATGMSVTIVRPPLIYGPGVGANFRRMMQWLHAGVPLPFGSIHNARSLIGLDNVCDLLAACATHPDATGQVFLASDGEDVSTTDLLRRLGTALGRPARLVPISERLLLAGLRGVGKGDVGRRLCESLRVDSSPARALLGWQPPLSLDEGLQRAAAAFVAEQAGAADRSHRG